MRLSIHHKTRSAHYCFHDIDLVDEGKSASEYEKDCDNGGLCREKQASSGVKLLWGTANVFQSRYMNGLLPILISRLAYTGLQIKNALDATIAMGGKIMFSRAEGRLYVATQYKYEKEVEHGPLPGHNP
jgi:xylose isomerase